MSTKTAHTALPWFKYEQYPDRFAIGAYRRGSLCIHVASSEPGQIISASGDESITESEAIANKDLIITAVNHHQELLTRLYNLVNAIENDGEFENLYNHTKDSVSEAKEILKKLIP